MNLEVRCGNNRMRKIACLSALVRHLVKDSEGKLPELDMRLMVFQLYTDTKAT